MKKGKGWLLLLAMAVMMTGMTGCGGRNRKAEQGTEAQKEFVWVPEFVEVSAQNMESMGLQRRGDILYYLENKWNDETQEVSFTLKGVSLADGSEAASVELLVKRPEEGETAQRNPSGCCVDSEGNIWTVENIYHWSESGDSRTEVFLCKYDKDGNVIAETDMSGELGENRYLRAMYIDSQNRMYLVMDGEIGLIDPTGAFRGKIRTDGEVYISSVGTDADGAVCAVVREYGAAGGKVTLREIDFDGRAFAAAYENFPQAAYSEQLVPGIEKSVLTSDGSRVYEYDKASQTAEELFNWLDSDVNGSDMVYMDVLEDGRILAVTRDWSSNDGVEVALLTKRKASEVQRKAIITVGCLYENQMLTKTAVNFNKTNEKYRVSIRTYYDYNMVTQDNYQQVMSDAIARINSDITSSRCPDLMDLSMLNMKQLASKGVFADLSPYLEKSSQIKREDYMESILDSYNYRGALVAIPRCFSLRTVAGKTSEVGDQPGWTLDEMLAYADKHPDAAIFDKASKADILSFLISYNQGAFVDWEKGTCDFQTDSFKSLLEFTNRFPDDYNWREDNDDRSTPSKIAAGEVLLNNVDLYNFNSIQEAEGMFGEPVTFIGYPNDSGESGCYLQADGLLAIAAKSRRKDGAWEFLEQYLMAEGSWYDFGFSTRKSALQKAREEATKVEYLLDENGEKTLDENGDPIVINDIGSVVSYQDGWTYEYHRTTEEEADKLMHLIEIAKPAAESDSQIMSIITEEAESFFQGDKSADDVASVVQSRVKLYIDENR